MSKGNIIKKSGNTITDIAKNDLVYKGKSISTNAKKSINETGKKGVFYN